MYIVYSWSPST